MEEKAAVYCRLSQDDGSVGESGSIQTQRTLLTQYCKEQHISIADYYCDDGWSGTNFERPEFQRMLEDIESGKVKRNNTCNHYYNFGTTNVKLKVGASLCQKQYAA